jgi:hypothetical protein
VVERNLTLEHRSLGDKATSVLATSGALAHAVLKTVSQCILQRLVERTVSGGQPDSSGKVNMKRIAPQRHPPDILSGRLLSVMMVIGASNTYTTECDIIYQEA